MVVLDLLVAIFAYISLRIANKKKCYRLFSWLFSVLIFFILFPILFLFGGAYQYGIDYLFMIAFIFAVVLFEGKERKIIIALQAVIFGTCFVIPYLKPQAVTGASNESIFLYLYISNFALVCVIIMVIIFMHNQVFKNRQEQIEELNRKLQAHNETLMRYDMMKSDFLATVAHEINTPLAIIAASSNDSLDLLKEKTPAYDEITENEIMILQKVKLVKDIVADLMDTAAIETGRITLDRKLVSLSALITSTCDFQHEKLDWQNNKLTYDLKPGLKKILLDPNKIEQVLINLLSNAARHTKGGNIEIKLIHKEGKQILSVSDDGEGMDEKMLETAFTQYVTTTSENWRHGIGLNLCYRIIKAHGGEIWLDSKKGSGTKISFSLREEV